MLKQSLGTGRPVRLPLRNTIRLPSGARTVLGGWGTEAIGMPREVNTVWLGSGALSGSTEGQCERVRERRLQRGYGRARHARLSRGRDRRAGSVTKHAVGARFWSRAAGGGRCPLWARDALCRPQAAPGLASSSSALPASSPGYIFPPANPSLECQPLTSVRSLYFQARCVRVFSGILTIKFFLVSLPGAPPPL